MSILSKSTLWIMTTVGSFGDHLVCDNQSSDQSMGLTCWKGEVGGGLITEAFDGDDGHPAYRS